MTHSFDDHETTILDDPIENAASSAWPDAVGLCAGGVEHWIRRLERLHSQAGLPPFAAEEIDQTLEAFLRPAAKALKWLADSESFQVQALGALAADAVGDA
ncbi:MAG: hypothetical protein AAGC60_17720 [Acidobacteriota bacterium]